MKLRFPLLLAASLAVALPATALAALPTADSQGKELPSLAPMLDKTLPGVVNIFTRTRVPVQENPLYADPFFRRFFEVPDQTIERYAQSLGSGVIVDAKNGYILTNHHVVDRAVEISVNLSDGRILKGELVGSDPETDVAVIKVPTERLTAIPLGDSERLRVGDFVVAVGNPFGLGGTVTSGIVSALGRSGLGIEGFENFIQTDASINPGNSGGALVNLRGELVGLNTAIISRSGGNVGIGFAIPVNMARDIMAQLTEHGEVRRGRLGVQAQDLTPELATAFDIDDVKGAVVTAVAQGSPAEKAGLKPGDVVVEINGRPVASTAEVRTTIGLLRVGEKVSIKIRRNGETLNLKAVVEEPAVLKVEGDKFHPRLGGAMLGNIVEGMPAYGAVQGVLIIDVAPASPAWSAGLRSSDVIVSANRQPVADLDSLRKVVKRNQPVMLNIVRGNGAFFLLLK